VSESPAISPARATTALGPPGLMGAFNGLWLLTWRNQLTLRQLPARLGTLLILPLLVYVTLLSANSAIRESRQFLARLEENRIPITPQTAQAMKRLLAEEMKQDEKMWRLRPGESAEARTQRLREQIVAGDERLQGQARGVLDEGQFAQFQIVEDRFRDNALPGRFTIG
jgi:hypothetical protein